MRRGILLINLTFIVAATGLFAAGQPAFADDAQAQQAIELLARSQTLDTKCRFLNAVDHDELSSLVARAELALAQRTTVDLTKQALTNGRNAGKNATCTDSERTDLAMILSSAKQAAAQGPTPAQPVAELTPAKPAVKGMKSSRMKMALSVAAPVKSKPSSRAESGLLRYASITERYYLARRCGSMSPRAISGFYQTVVNTHEAVLSSFGRAAVARVMQRSESKANAQSCS